VGSNYLQAPPTLVTAVACLSKIRNDLMSSPYKPNTVKSPEYFRTLFSVRYKFIQIASTMRR